MSDQNLNESMLDMYLYETSQNIENLENSIISCEKAQGFSQNAINDIFRNMHTIKGSSAMMLFNNIATLAHAMEDLFYFLREHNTKNIDYSTLSDLVLQGIDFIKVEIQKIKDKDTADGDSSAIIGDIKEFLELIKNDNNLVNDLEKPVIAQKQQFFIAPEKSIAQQQCNAFKATIFFKDGCEMENIRAYTIVHNLRGIAEEYYYTPEDIIENDESVKVIREHGFQIILRTVKNYQEIYDFFIQTIFLSNLELAELENDQIFEQLAVQKRTSAQEAPLKTRKVQLHEQTGKDAGDSQIAHQSIISVNVVKLDKLMDLMGEMVIAEAMVTQNPDLNGLGLINFNKAARQLRKITTELQGMIMSIRLVPLSATFQKMHRIVRDMSKKLNKEVELKLLGEETEVDKNIIEHISDPLMHLVRNSIDHGIEASEDRVANGKHKEGTVTLEAKNSGSDVLVIVKDDGKGLSKEKILQKAKENDLLSKPENEMTDKEIYSLILLPGFSTKDSITEFSGRGVGMDVVKKNIEVVGGTISIDSEEGIGTTTTLKIPLTLAIIDGMNIRVGSSKYIIPTVSIRESFKTKDRDIVRDPDGNEMIMVRGQCYPILRLHEMYGVKTDVTEFSEGILIMVEQDDRSLCLFADKLLGQQQVVVKALPAYIKNNTKLAGLAGCTLLGDGSISLILDIGGLINMNKSI